MSHQDRPERQVEHAPPPEAPAAPTPIHDWRDTAGPSPADKLSRKMDSRDDSDKQQFALDHPEQYKTAQAIERAIVTGDAAGLKQQLATLNGPAAEHQDMMNIVQKDLSSVGIHADWSFKQSWGTGDANGREDRNVGSLEISKDDGNGRTFSRLTFNTDGTSNGVREPIPSIDGRGATHDMPSPEDPAAGLKAIAAAAVTDKKT